MRKIEYLIVHCTATPEGREVTVEEITRWHIQRGFRTVGYNFVIYLDGSVHVGRPEEEVGAHCRGFNTKSIGIAYVGGTDARGKAKDTRTPEQKEALLNLLTELKERYPNAIVAGHNQFANKACPSFDAHVEYHKFNI